MKPSDFLMQPFNSVLRNMDKIIITGKHLKNLLENIDEVDFCYLCNNHVSSGHSKDCPLKKEGQND